MAVEKQFKFPWPYRANDKFKMCKTVGFDTRILNYCEVYLCTIVFSSNYNVH